MSISGWVIFFFCLSTKSLKSVYDLEKEVENTYGPLDLLAVGGFSSITIGVVVQESTIEETLIIGDSS